MYVWRCHLHAPAFPFSVIRMHRFLSPFRLILPSSFEVLTGLYKCFSEKEHLCILDLPLPALSLPLSDEMPICFCWNASSVINTKERNPKTS
jgi:hypothetical protein